MSKESEEKLVRFTCPKCDEAADMPHVWREFWQEHGLGVLDDPQWMEKAKAWFVARGHSKAVDKAMVCPVCRTSKHVSKWITASPKDAGKIFND